MKLLTFYRQIANTLLTDQQQSTDSWSTVGQQMSSRKLSFQGNCEEHLPSPTATSVNQWTQINPPLTDLIIVTMAPLTIQSWGFPQMEEFSTLDKT